MGIESSIKNAEKYLVQVLKRNNSSETFNELRYWMYHYGNRKTILDLPPSSDSIRLHILRAFYVTYQQINILKKDCYKLDPLNFGYIFDNDFVVPMKNNALFPPIDELVPNCNCKKCSTKYCACKAAGLSCTSFCICRSHECCENPYDFKYK